ncbi:MAG: PAS domain S-box protein, partial [Nitrospirota bacterium]
MNNNQEDQYLILFESNPCPMWVYDIETLRFLAVNNALIHHYGFSREQLLSMTIKEICHPEDLQHLLDTIPKIAKGLYFSGPWRTQKKDGSTIDVKITSHSINFDGKNARLVLANDISERIQAEEELKASYNLLHTVIEEIVDAIFVKDLRGRYLLINRPGARLIGKTKEEVICRDDSELFVPEAARQIMEDDRRIIDSGVTRTYEE